MECCDPESPGYKQCRDDVTKLLGTCSSEAADQCGGQGPQQEQCLINAYYDCILETQTVCDWSLRGEPEPGYVQCMDRCTQTVPKYYQLCINECVYNCCNREESLIRRAFCTTRVATAVARCQFSTIGAPDPASKNQAYSECMEASGEPICIPLDAKNDKSQKKCGPCSSIKKALKMAVPENENRQFAEIKGLREDVNCTKLRTFAEDILVPQPQGSAYMTLRMTIENFMVPGGCCGTMTLGELRLDQADITWFDYYLPETGPPGPIGTDPEYYPWLIGPLTSLSLGTYDYSFQDDTPFIISTSIPNIIVSQEIFDNIISQNSLATGNIVTLNNYRYYRAPCTAFSSLKPATIVVDEITVVFSKYYYSMDDGTGTITDCELAFAGFTPYGENDNVNPLLKYQWIVGNFAWTAFTLILDYNYTAAVTPQYNVTKRVGFSPNAVTTSIF